MKKKKLSKVSQNEIIKHVGDLVIEGDIEENAQVEVKHGSLTVLGSIKSGAKIKISIVIKNANIENRIYTNDMLFMKGGKYVIISKENPHYFSHLKPIKHCNYMVKATIDDKDYEAGEIIIHGSEITVEPQIYYSSSSSPFESKNDKKLPKFKVHGNVGNKVEIVSDLPIFIKENIANSCTIVSHYGGCEAKEVGESTSIQTSGLIQLKTVSQNCTLKSEYYGLNAEQLGNGVIVSVKQMISVTGNIGKECTIYSTQGGLHAKHIGNKTKIDVNDSINVSNVGFYSSLNSRTSSIQAHDVGDETTLKAYQLILLNNVGNKANIISQTYWITVANDVGNSSILSAHLDVKLKSMGDSNKITSKQRVEIAEQCGQNSEITATSSISIKKVGSCSSLTSQDEVVVTTVDSGVSITARKNIKIKGDYASDVVLNSNEGYVVKNDQRAFSPTKNTLSNALAIKKQGVFAGFNPVVQKTDNPSSLTCDY